MPTVEAQLRDIYNKLRTLTGGGGGGGGEANTASNLGAGVGVYDQKVGVDLQFRTLVADSLMVDIALGGAGNHEVHFDIDPSEIDLDDLGDVNAGAPANNEVLSWDTAASEWQAKVVSLLGGTVCWQTYRKSERYYTHWEQYSLTTLSATADYIYAVPFLVPVQQHFDRIALYVYAGTSRHIRLGLYEDDGSIYPGDLIHGTAELDASASGCKEETIDETLDPGLYWLACLSDVGGNVRALYQQYSCFSVFGRTDCYQPLTSSAGLRGSQAYGAMPDPFTAGCSEVTYLAAVMLRKS